MNSNVSALESDNVDAESELTYSKQIFSQDESETEILGLGWNKISNKISVAIPSMKEKKATKKKNINHLRGDVTFLQQNI